MFDKKEYDKEYYNRVEVKEHRKRCKQKWYIKNKDRLNEQASQWKKNHPKYIREYRLTHKEKHKEYTQRYYIENQDKYKLNYQKRNNKRRGLDFIPLNKPFVDCEAHHISQNLVVYIPREIHQNLYHSIWTWENMDIINKIAIEYL